MQLYSSTTTTTAISMTTTMVAMMWLVGSSEACFRLFKLRIDEIYYNCVDRCVCQSMTYVQIPKDVLEETFCMPCCSRKPSDCLLTKDPNKMDEELPPEIHPGCDDVVRSCEHSNVAIIPTKNKR